MDIRTSDVTAEQTAFSSILSGAYASAAVALLFLVIDGLRGDPLYTPSLMGGAVLLGDPLAGSPVRLDMVALYSLLHFLAFAMLGTAATFAYLRGESLRRHPALLSGLIFALLSLGGLVVETTVIPGLVGAIGVIPFAIGNAAAAGTMGWFIHSSLREVVRVPVAAVGERRR